MNDAPVSPMSLRIHHYCVVVPDIDEAVRWYEDKLDFEIERSFGFPEVGTQTAHTTNVNGVRIELIARDGSAAGPDVGQDPFGALLVQGSKYIGFLVDDIQATARELRRRGVRTIPDLGEGRVRARGGPYTGWFAVVGVFDGSAHNPERGLPLPPPRGGRHAGLAGVHREAGRRTLRNILVRPVRGIPQLHRSQAARREATRPQGLDRHPGPGLWRAS